MTVFLVRHGRTLGDELDPAGFDDVWALRDRLPQGAVWFTSPDLPATETCQLLTDGEVAILAGLRERADGETEAALHERVVGTVSALLAEHRGRDLVLVGHLDAWVAVAGEPAVRLGMPDLLTVDEPLGSAR